MGCLRAGWEANLISNNSTSRLIQYCEDTDNCHRRKVSEIWFSLSASSFWISSNERRNDFYILCSDYISPSWTTCVRFSIMYSRYSDSGSKSSTQMSGEDAPARSRVMHAHDSTCG